MIDIPGASSPTASWIIHFSTQYMSKRKVWMQCFQVNRAAAVTCRSFQNKGGWGGCRVRGCLIQRRSSFQSLLCTAAHLDADLRRTVNVCRASPPHWGAQALGTKVGCIYVSSNFFWLGCWDPSVISPFIRLHFGRQHVLQYFVPPVSITKHKDTGTQRIQRGSYNATDIEITPAIIKPKLAKWIGNWRGLSHSILVRACLRAHTHTQTLPGFVKSIVTIRSCLWSSAFFPLSPVSLHFCPTTSFSQSTPKSNKLLHRHWSFSHPNICIRKKRH